MPTATAGKRRALCVGIDNYDAKPLAGCVADAQLWERTLASLGFQCTMLLDRDATHGTIAAQLDRLIDSARPGDSLVWTFAGHGTMVPDVNGDEADGDSPGSDEAICPVDMHQGRFFVDDHIAERIQRLPQGVSFTMLMDCCHSGSLNRFGMGEPARAGAGNERSRFLPLTAQLRDAYLGFARSSGSRGASPRSRSTEAMLQTNEVLFTACQSSELAWESNGNGAFTLRATQLLSRRGGAMTNQEFHEAVLQSFGSTRRQTPTFTCADRLRNCNLFQAIEPVTRELFQVH